MAREHYQDVIRLERQARGWTQAEFGDRVGASVTTVSNWETGKTKPGLEDVNAIANALGISTERLLKSLGVMLTPPAAAQIPRDIIQDILACLEDPEAMAIIRRVAHGLRLELDAKGGGR